MTETNDRDEERKVSIVVQCEYECYDRTFIFLLSLWQKQEEILKQRGEEMMKRSDEEKLKRIAEERLLKEKKDKELQVSIISCSYRTLFKAWYFLLSILFS